MGAQVEHAFIGDPTLRLIMEHVDSSVLDAHLKLSLIVEFEDALNSLRSFNLAAVQDKKIAFSKTRFVEVASQECRAIVVNILYSQPFDSMAVSYALNERAGPLTL